MGKRGRPETPIHIRFLEKLVFDKSQCWLWGGAKHPQGYGFIKRKDGAQLKAHRVAYELAYGPIPAGMFVCHRCDIPSCVRPNHLFIGSPQDNMNDMVAKGRAARNKGERNGAARLTAEAVRLIRSSSDTYELLAKRFSVSPTLIGLIQRRQRWSHI